MVNWHMVVDRSWMVHRGMVYRMVQGSVCLMTVHLMMLFMYSMMGSMIKDTMADMMSWSRDGHMMSSMRYRSRKSEGSMVSGRWWGWEVRLWHHVDVSMFINMQWLV